MVFTIPSVDSLSEQQFLKKFGKIETAQVTRKDGAALIANTPSYIVRPASFSAEICQSLRTSSFIKIIDFGEAFLKRQAPRSLHTPLAVRAPEALFGDQIDHRVDLWSLGCLVCASPRPLPEQRRFNIFTAFRTSSWPAPFDSIMATPASVISQMLDFCSDQLPSRWRKKWQAMKKDSVNDDPCTLQQWLEEVYFDNEYPCEFTRNDIAHISRIVGQLLRFEPSNRARTDEFLIDSWLKC